MYRLNKALEVIPDSRAVAPLQGYFLADEDALKKAQEEVANQSKLRYGEEKK